MLTLEKLKSLPPNEIFATGILLDNEDGLFMTGSNKELLWVAVTGEINDFAIYTHFTENSAEWIKRQGDKVHDERNIRRCIEMDDEAFARYRY